MAEKLTLQTEVEQLATDERFMKLALQQAEEAGHRILRRQNRPRESFFKLRDDCRCVGEPSAIRRLNLRHLGNPCFAGAAPEVGGVHAHKFKGNALDTEIGFKLAGKV